MNQYHQEFLGIPFLKRVGLICVNFATFILNWCKVIESLHFCIPKIQATSASSSWFVSTPCGPCFFYFIFPFKWFERDVISIYQNLLVFFKDSCLFSTTSIVVSSTSNVHLPHCVKLGTLFMDITVLIPFLLVLASSK